MIELGNAYSAVILAPYVAAYVPWIIGGFMVLGLLARD